MNMHGLSIPLSGRVLRLCLCYRWVWELLAGVVRIAVFRSWLLDCSYLLYLLHLLPSAHSDPRSLLAGLGVCEYRNAIFLGAFRPRSLILCFLVGVIVCRCFLRVNVFTHTYIHKYTRIQTYSPTHTLLHSLPRTNKHTQTHEVETSTKSERTKSGDAPPLKILSGSSEKRSIPTGDSVTGDQGVLRCLPR